MITAIGSLLVHTFARARNHTGNANQVSQSGERSGRDRWGVARRSVGEADGARGLARFDRAGGSTEIRTKNIRGWGAGVGTKSAAPGLG